MGAYKIGLHAIRNCRHRTQQQVSGRQFFFNHTWLSMAASLPCGIGAQSGFPDRQLVTFTGDSSLSMMMGDLVTLAQHNVPVKVIAMKNEEQHPGADPVGADGLSGQPRVWH